MIFDLWSWKCTWESGELKEPELGEKHHETLDKEQLRPAGGV